MIVFTQSHLKFRKRYDRTMRGVELESCNISNSIDQLSEKRYFSHYAIWHCWDNIWLWKKNYFEVLRVVWLVCRWTDGENFYSKNSKIDKISSNLVFLINTNVDLFSACDQLLTSFGACIVFIKAYDFSL